MTSLSWALLCVVLACAAGGWWYTRHRKPHPPDPGSTYLLMTSGWLPTQIPYAIPREVGQEIVDRVSAVVDEAWPRIWVTIYRQPEGRPQVQTLSILESQWQDADGVVRQTGYYPSGYCWALYRGCPESLIALELASIARSMLGVYGSPLMLIEARDAHAWIAARYGR